MSAALAASKAVNRVPPTGTNVVIPGNFSLVVASKYTPPNNAKLILGNGAILKVL